MEHNVCGNERILRAVLGILVMAAGLYYGSWWGAIGLVPLVTAFVGYCPISHVIRYSSCTVRTSP